MNIKKYLTFFVLTFFVNFVSGQVYQSMPQYGYGPVKRFDVDSTLTIPTVCGVPTLKSNLTRKSAIAFDTCNNRFYFYNSKTLVWDTIKGGAGGSTDTTSLSNRINLKLNISDTANMLNPYLRKIDTTNKWVSSVTKLNDSTITVVKDGTTTNIVLNPQATRLITLVYNKTGSPITKGSVVYIDGKHSNNLPSIALAQANNENNSYKTFALVADDIQNMSSGYVIQAGEITGLNLPTASYTNGDILYLSPSVAGGYTKTKPLAPNHICKLGSVVNAHPNQGIIQIKIENGWQLDELSDVQIASVPADSTLLQFSRVDSLWHDVSPTTAIGSRYIKPSDTATMLTNYAKISAVNLKLNISDTSTMLSNYAKTSVVNTKLNISDSTIYFTKYRSDTMRTNIYSQLSQELNVADTATMLSKYLRKTDTVSLSNRINLKMNYSDTTSLSNRINLKVNISDTSTMLSPYLRSANAFGYGLSIGNLINSFIGSTTYYFGIPTRAASTTAAISRVYIPYSGTIKSAYLYVRGAIATTNENWTISIRLNNTSNTTLATVGNTSQDKVFSNTGLNISVSAGDYIEITTTTPAWTTNPGSTFSYGTIYIQ